MNTSNNDSPPARRTRSKSRARLEAQGRTSNNDTPPAERTRSKSRARLEAQGRTSNNDTPPAERTRSKSRGRARLGANGRNSDNDTPPAERTRSKSRGRARSKSRGRARARVGAQGRTAAESTRQQMAGQCEERHPNTRAASRSRSRSRSLHTHRLAEASRSLSTRRLVGASRKTPTPSMKKHRRVFSSPEKMVTFLFDVPSPQLDLKATKARSPPPPRPAFKKKPAAVPSPQLEQSKTPDKTPTKTTASISPLPVEPSQSSYRRGVNTAFMQENAPLNTEVEGTLEPGDGLVAEPINETSLDQNDETTHHQNVVGPVADTVDGTPDNDSVDGPDADACPCWQMCVML